MHLETSSGSQRKGLPWGCYDGNLEQQHREVNILSGSMRINPKKLWLFSECSYQSGHGVQKNFQIFLPSYLAAGSRSDTFVGVTFASWMGQSIHLGLIGLRMPFVSRKVSITMKKEQIFIPRGIHSVVPIVRG